MLIFDFDGVLLHSLDESLVTAHNAVTGELRLGLEELPADLVRLFRSNRFHFQPAGDALPLMKWCISEYLVTPDKILTRNEYQEMIAKESEPLVERTKKFFSARGRFFSQYPEKWQALNSIYQPLWSEIQKRGAEHLIILTNKNREATLAACNHFGLMLEPENVYSGDNGQTKIANFAKLRQRFPTNDLFFIDDSLSNLRELNAALNRPKKQLGLILANWGYLGADDERLAEAEGFGVFSQADAIALLDSHYGQD